MLQDVEQEVMEFGPDGAAAEADAEADAQNQIQAIIEAEESKSIL